MRSRVGSLVLVALAVPLLSGCVIPSEPSDGSLPHVDASTYKITLDWAAPSIRANQSFTFPMHVAGNVSSTSTHIGAHYWTSPQDDPTPTGALKCDHMQGEQPVPNDFQVTCKPAAPGHYYLRGHLQMTRGNELINWWSAEHEFVVQA